jgi:hypothetical protein
MAWEQHWLCSSCLYTEHTKTAQGNEIRADIKRHKKTRNAFVSVLKHEAYGDLTPLVEVRRLMDGPSALFTADQKYASRDGHVSVTCRCDASEKQTIF